MSLLLSLFAIIIFASATGIPIETRYMAMAILLAGGIAGIGSE